MAALQHASLAYGQIREPELANEKLEVFVSSQLRALRL
jgi:hypothetical protein